MIVGEVFRNLDIYEDYSLKIGEKYVMSASLISQLNRLFPRTIRKTDEFSELYNPLNVVDLEKGKRILLFRSGGVGDVMFMDPLIRILKNEFDSFIKVATSPMYLDVFKNNEEVDKLIRMPFNIKEMFDCDFHLTFEGVIEDLNDEEAKKNHAVDLFLKFAGINYSEVSGENKIPRIFLTDEEKARGAKIVQRLSGKNKSIGIQITASSPVRTFPIENIVSIIEKLLEENYSIYLFGGGRQSEDATYIVDILKAGKKVIDLTKKNPTLRDSMVLANFMDLIIAPDSAFVHIAGALGIPLIGLYGCFPSLIRMKYYRKAVGIDCDVACSPSFIHGHSPCHKGNPSPCFSVISTKNVIDAVHHLIGERDIRMEYPDYNEFVGGRIVRLLEGIADGDSEEEK